MATALLLFLSLAGQEAESKVREAIATLEKALVARDPALQDHLDLRGLLREMERRGSIPESGFRVRGVRRLEENLATLAASPGELNGGWNKIVPLNVRLGAAGDEAAALCRVVIGGKPRKFRLWMSRVDGTWRLSDLENLDGTYRLSVIGLQYSPGVRDDEDRQALRDGVMALQRGAVAVSKGRPEAAREALAMARRCAPPEYVLDWVELTEGLAQEAMGDTLLALKAADRVLVRQTDLAIAHRLKATCHAKLREHAQAIAAAMEYLKLVGDEPEAWTLVGESLEAMGKADEAMEAHRKAAAADPGDHASRWELGRMLVEGGRAKEAAPWFSETMRIAPFEESGFESAADLLDKAGAHAEALALAEEATARRPDDAIVLARHGRGLRTAGRLKEAEETLRRASRLHPEESEIARELIQVLAQTGKDADAQALIKKAADGKSWWDAYVRAFAHAAAGRRDRALEELAVVLRAESDLETILAWMDKEPVFEKLRTEKPVAAARATRDYWKARRTPNRSDEDMLRVARERAEAVPDHALAYFDQGCALRRLRRYAEAEALLRKAGELDKNLGQEELGRALAAQGKLEEALALAGERLERVAVNIIAGKREAAVKALQALLEKDPGSHSSIGAERELDEFSRLPAVQELLRKARAKVRK